MIGSSLQTVFPVKVSWVAPSEPPTTNRVYWLDFTDPTAYTVDGSNVPLTITDKANDTVLVPSLLNNSPVIVDDEFVAETTVFVQASEMQIACTPFDLVAGAPFTIGAKIYVTRLDDSRARLRSPSGNPLYLTANFGIGKAKYYGGSNVPFDLTEGGYRRFILVQRATSGGCDIYIDGIKIVENGNAGTNVNTGGTMSISAGNDVGSLTKLKHLVCYDTAMGIDSVRELDLFLRL